MRATACLTLLLSMMFLFQGCSRSWLYFQKDSEPHYTAMDRSRDIEGTGLEINFTAGKAFRHPVVAFWLEDTSGNFIQTLYVSETIGTGIFRHGKAEKGQWHPGPVQRPAALPVWGHARGKKNSYGNYLPEPKEPVEDAYTGATPQRSFQLYVTTDQPLNMPVKVFMEINQAFDFNEYWTNHRYPEDPEYMTSAQPALVYSTVIHPGETTEPAYLEPVGHAHYSGQNGKIYNDLSTFTTALKITENVWVKSVK